MGFFSWDCPCCQNSVRSRAATTPESAWMSDAVAVFEGGTILKGEYTGYGQVGDGDYELDYGQDFALYHAACYALAGKPAFTEPSRPSYDQGYFVGDYDPTKPQSETDLAALRQDATEKREASRRARQKALAGLEQGNAS